METNKQNQLQENTLDNNGLIYGYYLDGPNRGTPISWPQLQQTLPQDQCIWLHFDYTHENTKQWLRSQENLETFVVDALLEEETRPRASVTRNGVLISLRGVNLSPGSDVEDMVAIRVWSDGKRIISSRKRSLLSVQDVAALVDSQEGPETPGEFVSLLADRLISRMQETIQETEDRVSEIEEIVLTAESYDLRSQIANLRRRAISLRRYLAPQRDAMQQLQNEKITWLSSTDRILLRETNDHLIRYIEDLDSARDRAAVTQEELVNRLSEQLNSRMYVLSIVAAIFLPLGFLTGLLGINVGGIPGSDDTSAFWIFMGFLVVVVGLQVWIFKRKNWF